MDFGEDQPVGGEPSPVDLALDQLNVGLDHLVKLVEDGGLETLDDAGLVGFLHGFEQLRNRLPLVDHSVIGEATRRNLAETLCQSTLARMLTVTLRLSPVEAARRVRAAEAVGPRTSMLGQPLQPVRPHPGRSATDRGGQPRAGEHHRTGVGQGGPARVRPGRHRRRGGAAHPVRAPSSGPKTCRRLAEQVVDAIDPDGSRPNEKLNADRRFFHLRQTKDGGYAGEFRLTGECGVKLQALLGPLAKPRVNTTVGPDGQPVETRIRGTTGSGCTTPLEDVCDRLLRADTRSPTPAAPRPR